MTELTLKVNHAAKSVQTTGRVAVGEDVALNLVMDEEVADLAQLRTRLRFMGRDVAVFPFPGSGDEWTEGEAGENEYTYTGVINLNTVQFNALFAELGDGAVLTCAVVVDQVSNDDGTDDYNVLYGKGLLRVWNWNGDLHITPDVDEAPAPVSLRECLEGKVDKVVTATSGNVAVFTTNGGVADGAVSVSDGALSSSSSTVPTSRAVKAEIDAVYEDMAQDVTDLEGMIAEKADSSDLADKADKADLNDKVDKVAGKSLSTNDFTDALKNKLDDMADYSEDDAEKLEGIEDGATKVIVDADITEDSANAVASGAVFDMKEHLHQKIDAVYTKTEVDAIVAAVKTGSRQVVESLDSVTDPKPLVIYMVAKASAQTSNIYDEYIWIVSEGVGSWEKIGDTEVDLSGYVQKETGKGLSSNDYTTEEKQKLAGVEAGAQKNVTPTAPSTDASAAGKPADAKATGDALAARPTKTQIDAGWWSEWTVLSNDADVTAECPQPEYRGTPPTWACPVLTSVGWQFIATLQEDADETSLAWSYGSDNYTATRHRVAAPVPTKPSDIGAVQSVNGVTPTEGNLSLYGTNIESYIGSGESVAAALANLAQSLVNVAASLRYALDETQVIDTASTDPQTGMTYGEVEVADRTANAVSITTAIDELRIEFPESVSGYVRDFELCVSIAAAVTTAPALVIVAPSGETIVAANADGALPQLVAGDGTAAGVMLLCFSEKPPAGHFFVKGEELKEVPNA